MRNDEILRPIVIVEDNDDDFEVVQRALIDAGGSKREIIRFGSGAELLEFLSEGLNSEDERDFVLPAFIILDLNLPGIDGRDVLIKIKSDQKLKKTPVVVMTVSSDQRDVERCYEAGANTFIAKPIDWNEFFNIVARMKEYWLNIAVLPGNEV